MFKKDKKDKKEDGKKDDKKKEEVKKEDKKKDDKKKDESKKEEKKKDEPKKEEAKKDKKEDKKKDEPKKDDKKDKKEAKKDDKKDKKGKEDKETPKEAKEDGKKEDKKKKEKSSASMFSLKKDKKGKEDKKDEKKEDDKAEKKDDKKGTKDSKKGDQKDSPKTVKAVVPPVPKEDEDFVEVEEQHLTYHRLINNPLHSDLQFVFPSKQKISAHNCILESRATGLLKNAKEKKSGFFEVEIPATVTYETFLQVINYVYLGTLEFAKLNVHDVVLVLAVTSHWDGLQRLKWLCETYLKKELSMKNAHHILKELSDLNLKLKDHVMFYAVQNYKEFIGNKAATKEIGIELLQDVVGLYQKFTQGELKAPADPEEPVDTYRSDFKGLHDSGKYTDINFSLVATNMLGISGSIYKCHKAIIAGRAPGLASLCKMEAQEVSRNVMAVTVKGISTDAFEALLKWIYYAEAMIPTAAACELASYARRYKLTGLMHACVNSMKETISVETVLMIMDAVQLKNMPQFYQTEMQALKPKCVSFCLEHLNDLDFEKIREKKMHRSIAPDVLEALQKEEKQ